MEPEGSSPHSQVPATYNFTYAFDSKLKLITINYGRHIAKFKCILRGRTSYVFYRASFQFPVAAGHL